MRLLAWNYQGLGNPWIVRSLHNLVREQVPTVCFLMETRLDKDSFNEKCRELPFQKKLIVKKPNSGVGLGVVSAILTLFFTLMKSRAGSHPSSIKWMSLG